MVTSNNIVPGMTLSINNKLFRVESSIKVTVPKGTPFIKAMLKDLTTGKVQEKNFQLDQQVQDVALEERHLEFLYLEGSSYLFLDVNTLDQVLVPVSVIADKANYLKEGIQLVASFYGDTVFSVDLPQFLELMISKVDQGQKNPLGGNGNRTAVLESGAKIEVPPFIEVGDIIKVDTRTNEYIQRV